MLLIFIPYVLLRQIIEFSFHWSIGANVLVFYKSTPKNSKRNLNEMKKRNIASRPEKSYRICIILTKSIPR